MIRFRMLGTLDLKDSQDREVQAMLRRPKLLALLGYLAAARPSGFHRRDTLVALLWPELDNAHARNALRQAVHALRTALGRDVVVARGEEEVRLNEKALSWDTREFEAALEAGDAEQALELYRGGLLEGVHVLDAPEFERWLDTEREQLRRRACEAAEHLVDQAETAGNVTSAVRWALRVTEMSPFDETAVRRLIQLLDRGGDRAGAVRAYEEFERRMDRDLGVQPSPETGALVDGIRSRRNPTQPATPGESAPMKAEAPEPERSPVLPDGQALRAATPRFQWQRKILLAFALLALLVFGVWLTGIPEILWARYRGIPSLRARVAAGDWEGATQLAGRLEAVIPHDSSVAALRATFADTVSIEGTPAGSRVYRRSYNDATARWEFLGLAPNTGVIVPRLPLVSQFKFEAPGFRTGTDIGAAAAMTAARTVLRFALPPDSVAPPGMVLVVGGDVATGIPQLDIRDRAYLPDFYIGRLEVTNREYQVFVDSGGYRRREFWPEEFVADGRRLSWKDAIARFVDQTGRPGPSTWEAGRYPTDRADHPVAGVSWYEAMAYARFRGARLPNVFQWTRAARFEASGTIVTVSNIDRVRGGTAPVGTFRGMSGSGTLDMAGNVREWCLNESHNVRGHYILGGGWNDPAYTFYESAIQRAFDRSATNGIRLVRPLPGQEGDAAADRAIEPYFRDYRAERPASDEIFRFYRRLYTYDRGPLHTIVERRDSSATWIREKVSFDAAYGGERVMAYIFLPPQGHPPYQTVVFFPGSTTLRVRSSDSLLHVGMIDYLVEAGRAVVYPVLKGTYERDDGTRFSDPDESNRYKEHVVQWLQDVSRTLDYLSTRTDVDTAKFGYFGFSWGGRLGGVVLSIEPRFRAGVLTVAGFSFRRPQLEVDDINYMPRVHVPVLMINGRYDNTFPLETAARPMYDLLGTPPNRKRLVIVSGVHYVPRNVLIRETLDWFDLHLGPVR